MTARYFRAAASAYEAVCVQLDAAYGYPNAETKTARTLPAAADLPSDAAGRVYLSISRDYCDYVLPAQMLPSLLANGTVEELTPQEYFSAIPPWRP
jgi:hypothetical protein